MGAKLAIGVGFTIACRLPQYIFHSEGLIANMLHVMTVMLRCMSLVMLVIRDDVTVPKKDKDKADRGDRGDRSDKRVTLPQPPPPAHPPRPPTPPGPGGASPPGSGTHRRAAFQDDQ